MSIDFTEKTIGLWYVAMEGKNWMCGVTQVGENRFDFKYRIRYYDDPVEPWDGKDRKSWYSGTVEATRELVITKMSMMALGVIRLADGRGDLTELIRGVDEPFDHFMDRFLKLPFVHAKEATEQQFRDQMAGQP